MSYHSFVKLLLPKSWTWYLTFKATQATVLFEFERFCIQTAWTSATKEPNCPLQTLQAQDRQPVLQPLWRSSEVPYEQRLPYCWISPRYLHTPLKVSLFLTYTHWLSFPVFPPYFVDLFFCLRLCHHTLRFKFRPSNISFLCCEHTTSSRY